MKKLIIVALVVGILAVVGVAGYQLFFQKTDVEKILPSGPIVYFRSTQTARQIEDLTHTQAWKKMEGIKLDEFLAQAQVSAENIRMLNQVRAQLTSPAFQALIKKLFGRELVVAVYPADIVEFTPEAIKTMLTNVFFVTRLSPDVQVAETFAKVFVWLNKEVIITSEDYKKAKVYTVATKDGLVKIGYTRIGDLLVFGFGDHAAKSCLSIINRSSVKPLSADDRFLKVRSGFSGDSNVQGYYDLEKMLFLIEAQMVKLAMTKNDDPQLVQKQVTETFSKFKGFSVAGFSGQVSQTIRFKGDLYFNKADLPSEAQSFYSCAPQDNPTIKFIPQNVLAYQWSPCYDFKNFWEISKKELQRSGRGGSDAAPEQVIEDLEKQLGLRVEEDILPALGSQFGGSLVDLKTEGIIPQVKLVFFLEVTDQAKAQRVVETLLTRQQMFMPQKEDYNGVELKYLTVPMVPNFMPAYALWNNYLLVATDRELIKNVLQTAANSGQALANDPLVRLVEPDIIGKNNGVFFLQLGKVMERMIGFVDFGNQWVAAQEGKREAFAAGLQKRREDLALQIAEQDAAIKNTETQLAALDASAKSILPVEPSQQEALTTEINGLRAKVQEKEPAINSAKAAGQDASAVTAEKELHEKRIAQLQGQSDELERRRSALAESGRQKMDLEAKLTAAGKERDALIDKKIESETMVANYDKNRPMPAALRNALVTDIVKPALQGLTHCPVFATKTLLKSDVMEVYLYLKVE